MSKEKELSQAERMSGLWFWRDEEQRPIMVGDGWTQAERLSGQAQIRGLP